MELYMNIWWFLKIGVPPYSCMVDFLENLIEMDGLEVPLFQENSTWNYIELYQTIWNYIELSN